MKGKSPVKIPDILIILLSLGLTGFSAFTVYLRPQNITRVVIQGQTQTWVFPLDAEETVNVKGPLGTTVVRIHDKEAWVEDSPCENKTCMAAGHIHEKGSWVACLPNSVFLVIEGNNEQGNSVDSVAW